MKKLWAVWFVIQLLLTSTAEAQSIVEIPKGTVFTLLEELEIPANRDFILLGQSELDEAFNASGQVLNDQAGRPLVRCGTGVHQPGYLTFTTYYQGLFESYEQTYLNCLQRHRVYVRAPGPPAPPVVIQQGHGNVAVINQHGHPTDTVYTAIGDNYCTPPNHTVAALVINQNKADGGGFFAKGYQFKVSKVRWQRGQIYHVVKVYFDHTILKGLVIVTTHDPETISMAALNGESTSSSGFWAVVGDALADLTNIGGGYFRIELPGKRYYD